MSISLIRLFGLLLLSPVTLAAGIIEIPESVVMEMCRTLSDDKSACVKGKTLQFSQLRKLDDDRLLAFYHSKNNEKQGSLSVPLLLSEQGVWKLGQRVIGQPDRIQRDNKRRFWMKASYFFLVNRPLVYMSDDGLSWQSVPLPFDDVAGRGFQQRDIGRWCVTGQTLFIELAMSTATGSMSKRFWQANIRYLLQEGVHSSQKWQLAFKQSLDGLACESVAARNNAWEVQDGESLSLLLLDKSHLTVKLPKELVIGAGGEKPVLVKEGPKPLTEKPTTVAKKDRFAIQVAAYRQHELASGVVTILKKAKFTTFTRTLEVNGESLKKVCIGPFESREEALSHLRVFKVAFNEHEAFQSAYVMRLP